MNPRLIHRLVTGLVAVAALALLVPSLGLGAIRPDDRSGPLGAVPASSAGSYTSYDDVFMRAVARHEAPAVRPDDRSGPLGVGSIVNQPTTVGQIRPDDRSGPLGAQPITTGSRTVSASLPTTSSSSDGFHWRDAALGAAGMLALCAAALGAVTLQRQHRRTAIAH
jgi:hypothetical protein